jgi:hypothetical protein
MVGRHSWLCFVKKKTLGGKNRSKEFNLICGKKTFPPREVRAPGGFELIFKILMNTLWREKK